MRVTIWGCRGSVATPGPETVGSAGTPRASRSALDDGTVLVLDAGTGISELGVDLVDTRRPSAPSPPHAPAPRSPRGAPLLRPLFDERRDAGHLGAAVAGAEPRGAHRALLLAAALPDRPPRPPRPGHLPRRARGSRGASTAQPWLRDLVIHPGPTVGYRVETAESSFAYLPDHEPALGGIVEQAERLDLRRGDRRGRRRAGARRAVLRGRVRDAGRLGPLERRGRRGVPARRSAPGASSSSITSRSIRMSRSSESKLRRSRSPRPNEEQGRRWRAREWSSSCHSAAAGSGRGCGLRFVPCNPPQGRWH